MITEPMPTGTTIIKTNGDPFARAYALVEVRPGAPEPGVPLERVLLIRPTQTVTRTGARAGAGPRAPHQRAWPPEKGAAVVLPDGRPLTKAQRFWIDPDLFARWDAEAEVRRRPSA
jgi:hypothetical protein